MQPWRLARRSALATAVVSTVLVAAVLTSPSDDAATSPDRSVVDTGLPPADDAQSPEELAPPADPQDAPVPARPEGDVPLAPDAPQPSTPEEPGPEPDEQIPQPEPEPEESAADLVELDVPLTPAARTAPVPRAKTAARSAEPSSEPSAAPSSEPSAAPSDRVAPSAAAAATPEPGATASPEATPSPSASPSAEPTPSASPEPTAQPSPTPSAGPEPSPSAEPAPEPGVVAELEPTDTSAFSMVGLTWAGGTDAEDVGVQVRTRDTDGDWSTWQPLAVDDPQGTEGARTGAEPLWVGESDAVAVRVTSGNGVAPDDLRLVAIDPGADPAVSPSSADAEPGDDLEPVASYPEGAPAYISAPTIIARKSWGAAAPKKCDSPTVASQTMGVVVHHTAGGNSYAKSESAAIVRSAQKYHQQALGWCDIGYNVLVDKYGQVFEGRAGGVDKMVRGAHAGNSAVNQYTWGVSMMGNFDTMRTTTALKNAMVKVVGWRLASNYLPAKGTFTVGGKKLNRIAGHRDVKATACPGRYGYDWLKASGGLRDRVEKYISKYTSPNKRLYLKLGRGTTGAVKVGEKSIGGGRRTEMQKMELFYTAGPGARTVRGPVLTAYRAQGRESGPLRFPTSEENTKLAVAYQRFQDGTIYRPTSKSAYAVYSVHEDLYRQLKEFRGTLGRPVTSTRKMTSNLYRVQLVNGRIDYKISTRTATAYDKKGKAVASRKGTWVGQAATAPAAPKPTASADRVTVKGASTLTVSGRGFGHGIGMSQYGAQGAARQGKKASQILSYYYPGTRVTKVARTMRVLISADTTADVQVKARSGLKVTAPSAKTRALPSTMDGKAVARWRLTPSGSRTALQYLVHGGSWKSYQGLSWAGVPQFEGPSSVGVLELVLPGPKVVKYRGYLRSARPSAGSSDRQTINVVSLDKYVQGVLAAEMPASWHQEALRAQAIAARTYAVRSMSSARYYDVCDTTACQVYKGYSAETSATNTAVAAVPGRVLTYRGVAALTQFSSSTGGRTASGNQPYLVVQTDAYDGWSGNPNHTWKVSVKTSALQRLAPSIGTLNEVVVAKRTGGGTWGGRATSVVLKGTKGVATLTGDQVRFGVGLRSTWFAFG